MERLTTDIYNNNKFKHMLNEFYVNKSYNSLILKFDREKAKFINYFISEIENYKKNNKIDE